MTFGAAWKFGQFGSKIEVGAVRQIDGQHCQCDKFGVSASAGMAGTVWNGTCRFFWRLIKGA
jgi:hypothetical protein